jgi:hypothetical protein
VPAPPPSPSSSSTTIRSKTVFFDLGASLEFHGGNRVSTTLGIDEQPGIALPLLYAKFGMPFDDIYAYEMKFVDPTSVFSKLPDDLASSYHWINVGVTNEGESYLNPLKVILETYTADDLVVIKLDIDTPWLELALTEQVLLNEAFGKGLIDQFYFEHHVRMQELRYNWKKTTVGTIKDSLDLFTALREAGIPAHFWP